MAFRTLGVLSLGVIAGSSGIMGVGISRTMMTLAYQEGAALRCLNKRREQEWSVTDQMHHKGFSNKCPGVEALVSCGMMEALLKVINWYSEGQEHITFVTRAVRVIDLITNLDMAAFQAHGGLQAFIKRLEHEVDICRREQPFVMRPQQRTASADSQPESPPMAMETESSAPSEFGPSTSAEPSVQEPDSSKPGVQCFPQRAALLKSMLNFLKKAIPDAAFAESIRHLMDGSLPKSLKHIISNAEYYGPSLFLLATYVVTVYVFQEPSLLSSLQDNGLTDVVLHALLIKDVPATREVLASLPNVFSALCLNARGLTAFVNCRPFDRLFKVLLSPDYLPAMRRRRSSDPFGDIYHSCIQNRCHGGHFPLMSLLGEGNPETKNSSAFPSWVLPQLEAGLDWVVSEGA